MDLTNIFLEEVEGNKDFLEALDIVKANTIGRYWLVGGFLSRNLIKRLYGTTFPDKTDIDFVVDDYKEPLKLPQGWEIGKSSFGSPRLIKGNKQIDYFRLKDVYSIKLNKLEPTLNNFFKGCPFTIQCLAYDFEKKQIVGDIGREALISKVFTVNNLMKAQGMVEKYNLSLQSIMKKKAESMNFQMIYP